MTTLGPGRSDRYFEKTQGPRAYPAMIRRNELTTSKCGPPTSKPTSAATPASPRISPVALRPSMRSVPVMRATTAPAIGTAATSNPESELVTVFSALDSTTQGTTISTTV